MALPSWFSVAMVMSTSWRSLAISIWHPSKSRWTICQRPQKFESYNLQHHRDDTASALAKMISGVVPLKDLMQVSSNPEKKKKMAPCCWRWKKSAEIKEISVFSVFVFQNESQFFMTRRRFKKNCCTKRRNKQISVFVRKKKIKTVFRKEVLLNLKKNMSNKNSICSIFTKAKRPKQFCSSPQEKDFGGPPFLSIFWSLCFRPMAKLQSLGKFLDKQTEEFQTDQKKSFIDHRQKRNNEKTQPPKKTFKPQFCGFAKGHHLGCPLCRGSSWSHFANLVEQTCNTNPFRPISAHFFRVAHWTNGHIFCWPRFGAIGITCNFPNRWLKVGLFIIINHYRASLSRPRNRCFFPGTFNTCNRTFFTGTFLVACWNGLDFSSSHLWHHSGLSCNGSSINRTHDRLLTFLFFFIFWTDKKNWQKISLFFLVLICMGNFFETQFAMKMHTSGNVIFGFWPIFCLAILSLSGEVFLCLEVF